MATKRSRANSSRDGDALVGRFFLTRDDDAEVDHRGEVLARVQEGVYLVQVFDAKTNAPSHQLVIDIDRMMDEEWELFDTRAAMLRKL